MAKTTSSRGKSTSREFERNDDLISLAGALDILKRIKREMNKTIKNKEYVDKHRRNLTEELVHYTDEISNARGFLEDAKSVPGISYEDKNYYQESIRLLNLANKRINSLLKSPKYYTDNVYVLLNDMFIAEELVASAIQTLSAIRR